MFETTLQFKLSFKNACPGGERMDGEQRKIYSLVKTIKIIKNSCSYFVIVKKRDTNNTPLSWPCDVTHHITLQTHLLSLLSPGLENGPFCSLKQDFLPPGVSETYWYPCLQACLPPLPPATSTPLPPVCCSPHAPLTSSTFCNWWFFLSSQETVSWNHWMFLYILWLNSAVTSSAITHFCLHFVLFFLTSPFLSATLY